MKAEKNTVGSGKCDCSGDVAATPASGSVVKGKTTLKTAHNEYAALQNNHDTMTAEDKRRDTTGMLNGHSTIMPSSNQS